tara:strand:- start:164 stop:424 length:261 start_codon:yes stop_codon:yes gene_type:complete
MKLSIELTLTPLKNDFIISIKSFIKQLRELGFDIKENPLSTQIYGDFDLIMNKLVPLIKKTFHEEKSIMLHLKMVKGDRSKYKPDF